MRVDLPFRVGSIRFRPGSILNLETEIRQDLVSIYVDSNAELRWDQRRCHSNYAQSGLSIYCYWMALATCYVGVLYLISTTVYIIDALFKKRYRPDAIPVNFYYYLYKHQSTLSYRPELYPTFSIL